MANDWDCEDDDVCKIFPDRSRSTVNKMDADNNGLLGSIDPTAQ